MFDCEIITISVLGEALGIDSENYLFGKLKSDHLHDFPNLIDRSNFYRRRKRLGDYIAKFNNFIMSSFCLHEVYQNTCPAQVPRNIAPASHNNGYF